MGGGSYSYLSASSLSDTYERSYATSLKRGKSSMEAAREIFTSRYLDNEMNIKGKIRESRDSDEHPNSFPVIIALDVTGSMGKIPAELITNGFPKIMKGIIDSGIADPQVCFLGIGDHNYDDAPLQVGQFESSDELLDKWFKKIYLEGGGGSNIGEDYGLAWYFAAYHTDIDSFEKRGKKGVLITIGDEPILDTVDEDSLKRIFGENQYSTNALDALNDCRKKWDVHHIHVTSTYSGGNESRQMSVKQMLNESVILTETQQTVNEIPAIITKIVVDSYKNGESKSLLVDKVEATPVIEEKKESIFSYLDKVREDIKF